MNSSVDQRVKCEGVSGPDFNQIEMLERDFNRDKKKKQSPNHNVLKLLTSKGNA